MLDVNALKAKDLKGLSKSAVAELAASLLTRLAAQSEAIAAKDAHIARRDREIKFKDAKIERTTFELARLKACCGPHGTLTSYEAFSSSASAHSLPPGPLLVLPAEARIGRVGISPTDQPCLGKAHTTTTSRTSCGPGRWVARHGCSRAANWPASARPW